MAKYIKVIVLHACLIETLFKVFFPLVKEKHSVDVDGLSLTNQKGFISIWKGFFLVFKYFGYV